MCELVLIQRELTIQKLTREHISNFPTEYTPASLKQVVAATKSPWLTCPLQFHHDFHYSLSLMPHIDFNPFCRSLIYDRDVQESPNSITIFCFAFPPAKAELETNYLLNTHVICYSCTHRIVPYRHKRVSKHAASQSVERVVGHMLVRQKKRW